jgi:hypothetical protein
MFYSVLTQYRNKKGINGRFSRSEKVKKFWKTWDTAVNISDKKLNSNSREYYHRNSLVDKIKLTEKESQDYKLKIIGDAKTRKMYEEYFKTHSYK